MITSDDFERVCQEAEDLRLERDELQMQLELARVAIAKALAGVDSAMGNPFSGQVALTLAGVRGALISEVTK